MNKRPNRKVVTIEVLLRILKIKISFLNVSEMLCHIFLVQEQFKNHTIFYFSNKVSVICFLCSQNTNHKFLGDVIGNCLHSFLFK